MSNLPTRRLLTSKTYGKNSQKYIDSSKAFDDAVNIKSSNFNIKAVSTIARWGKLTFTSNKTSNNDRVDTTRKRKLLDEPEDPFSFEPKRTTNQFRKALTHKRAKYKFRLWHETEEDKQKQPTSPEDKESPEEIKEQKKSTNLFDDFEFDDGTTSETPPILTKTNHLSLTTEPAFDQVVRDVKQAHECQESGETQEFTDDVEYLMDGLDKKQALGIRCLSALSLISKCTSSVFRMHLRAHGIISRVFTALSDSPECPALALCVACLFVLMSRDRLSIDLEKSSYQLMLKLLSVDDALKQASSNNSSSSTSKRYLTSTSTFFKSKNSTKQPTVDKDYQNVQSKVHNLCTKPQNSDKPILPDLILSQTVTSKLAMEALLRFSARKDVEFFKDELRVLGGLDRIIDACCHLVDELPEDGKVVDDNYLRHLENISQFLRVFENVTCLNASNQNHLLTYKSAIVTHNLNRCLKLCCHLIPLSEFEERNGKLSRTCSGSMLYNCLLSVLNVLVNITNDNTCGCSKVGLTPGLIGTLLTCLLKIPSHIPSSCQFDLIVLCLGLTINLVEHSRNNMQILLETKVRSQITSESSSVRVLGELFSLHYEAAKSFEEEHDAELESAEASQTGSQGASGADCSGEWVETEAGVEWVSHQGSQSQRSASSQERPHRVNSMFSQDTDNFSKALHKAGRHMEDSIVAAYVALLIGCIIKHESELAEDIRDTLPDYSFDSLSRMLKKFYNFMNITQGMRSSCGKSILQIIRVLESC